MSKTAKQIVAKLLEYGGFGPEEVRSGSPEDPWRKGGHMKVNLKKMDFTGQRPGEAAPGDEEKEDKPADKPIRFHWKPPANESVKSLVRE